MGGECAVLVILHICPTFGNYLYTHTLHFLFLLLLYLKIVTPIKNIMPSQKPRVALTLPDDLNAVFERISTLQGVPKTKVILELLTAYQPVLEQTLDALEKIEQDKENAQKIAEEFGQNLLLDASVMLGNVSKEVQDL